MRKYSSDDQKNLSNLVDELLTESWFDRVKARGAQAIGAIKGTKELAKGIGYGMKSGFDDSGESYNKSKEYIKSGFGRRDNAKIDSYLNSVNNKIEDFKSDVMSDLTKLNINIPDNQKLLINKAFEMLSTQVNRALTNLKYVAAGAPAPAPTPAPAPAPSPAPTPSPAPSPAPTPSPAPSPAPKPAPTSTPAARSTPKTPAKKAAKKVAKSAPKTASKTTTKRK